MGVFITQFIPIPYYKGGVLMEPWVFVLLRH